MACLVRRKHRTKTTFYLQYRLGGKTYRSNLGTGSKRVAEEKLRQFESAQAQGSREPLPTRTTVGDVVQRYVEFIGSYKTPTSYRNDCWYLFQMFGPVCPTLSAPKRQRAVVPPADVLYARWFEDITTAQCAAFVTGRVLARGLSPKSANRYREVEGCKNIDGDYRA